HRVHDQGEEPEQSAERHLGREPKPQGHDDHRVQGDLRKGEEGGDRTVEDLEGVTAKPEDDSAQATDDGEYDEGDTELLGCGPNVRPYSALLVELQGCLPHEKR